MGDPKKNDSLAKYMRLIMCLRGLCGLHQSNVFFYLIVVLVTAAVFIALVVLTYMAYIPTLSLGIFTGHFAVYYNAAYSGLTIIPASWAFFLIWTIIFVLKAISIGYAIFAFFLPSASGPTVLNPPILSTYVWIAFIFGMVANIAWIFAFNNAALGLALTLNSLAIFLYLLSTGFLAYNYFLYKDDLDTNNRGFESFIILVASLNGLAMLTAWMVYLAFTNFAMIISAFTSVEMASIIALVSLGVLIAIYFVLDISIIEPYTRFVITPYIVMAIALIASLQQNFNPPSLSTTINVALIVAVIGAGLAKLAVSFYNNNNNNNLSSARYAKKARMDAYKLLNDDDLPLKV